MKQGDFTKPQDVPSIRWTASTLMSWSSVANGQEARGAETFAVTKTNTY